MNTVSSGRLPARALALPNLLTYARIAAVPVVVALLYWQSILNGGLWLRWVALAVFIGAGVTDILDGHFARWGQQSASAASSIRLPTSCSSPRCCSCWRR